MPEETEVLDVKPEASDSSPKADAIDSSSESRQPAEADANAGQSMADFISKGMEAKPDAAAEPSPEAEGEVPPEGEQSDSKNELDQKKKEGEGEQEAPEPEEAEVVEAEENEAEQKPVPYERFQEVISEKAELKQRLDEVSPKVQNYENISRFCDQNQITSEQFDTMLQVQALLNTDPPAALKALLPVVEALQGFVGNKLPADLQTKVDTGKMELDDAKEIASLRAKHQFGEKKNEHDRRTWQQKQAAEEQRTMLEAAKSWESAKRTSDPDYKPKAKPTDPNGKWEMVKSTFIAMLNEVDQQGRHVNPVSSVKEMQALQDKAYAEVSATYTNLLKKRTVTRKPLLSNGSSSNKQSTSIEDAPTMAEAIRRGMKMRR